MPRTHTYHTPTHHPVTGSSLSLPGSCLDPASLLPGSCLGPAFGLPCRPGCSIEYNMSYVYHSMHSYFARDNVGLPGFAAFFR